MVGKPLRPLLKDLVGMFQLNSIHIGNDKQFSFLVHNKESTKVSKSNHQVTQIKIKISLPFLTTGILTFFLNLLFSSTYYRSKVKLQQV